MKLTTASITRPGIWSY